MFGSSQDIPDDVVFTEVKKTLVNGTAGILRCRFKGLPNAVFWQKRSDTAKSPSIMNWSYGKKSGPRYEDGSCDMDGNYSLVIRNLRNTDAGRYICRVSNYKGILIYNYTDVMITNSAVRTEQNVAAQKGKVGVVPCQVNIRPRRVSWVRGANDTLVSMDLSRRFVERSGPGYEDGLFNITKEYSLLIDDIKILHEDSYFCEATDFDTGHLFRNVSGLNVFAFPLEPFPSIEECPREQKDLSSCTLRIASQTALTCEVREYYPVIDLFFMHGSLRVGSLETRVWNNSDGTRNKRITIATNGSSETVFECVARGLVGEAGSRSMTIHLIRDVQQTRVAVAVVVPVILLSGIGVIAVFIFKQQKRHMTRIYDRVCMVNKGIQRDAISYIELWKLVMYAREQNLSDKLEKVLDKPIKDEESCKILHTDEDYYHELCRWKAEYTGEFQREDFFYACRNAGLKSTIDELQNYSDSTRAVNPDDLEHTLWHITERDRIIVLLQDLGALHEHLEVLKDKGKREVVEGAINILKQLRDVNNSSGNQEVMLSLALETIKCTPCDDDFFRIPECQKRGLAKNEIQAFLLPQITSRHCRELIDAMTGIMKQHNWDIKEFGSENRDVRIDNVIEQNRTALFDSHQMIEDWWAEQNCSNYEKRCRLRHAANVLKGRTDDMVPKDDRKESDKKWPTTKKLEQIAKLVPQPSMIQLCRARQIPHTPEDLNDEEKRLEVMSRWRDNMAEQKQGKKREILSTALKAINFDGLLSRPKGRLIYKTELVDLSLDLIMEDFRLFATALGIRETKITSYRQDFRDSHLGLGTIRLVLQLFYITENGCLNEAIRGSFSSILDKAGYPNAMKRFTFAFEPSYGELFAIATAVVEGDKTKVEVDFTEMNKEENTVKEPKNNEVVEMEQAPSNDDEEQAELQSDYHTTLRLDVGPTSIDEEEIGKNDDGVEGSAQDFTVVKKAIDDSETEIKSKLAVGLREKDLGDLQIMLELTDKDIPENYMASVLTLLKIWKERVCPGLIDHRVVLTEGLQKINKLHLVGRYQVRETSIDFIKDMLDEMDGYRRTCLERLLKSRKYRRKQLQSSDMTSQWICDWVADWTKEMESSVKNKLKDAVRVKEWHRDFNDKLVEHGLLDLAREIMNIEQVL